LENILILNNTDSVQIKLLDFGCSTSFKPGQMMKKCCGSVFYIAPEVWLNYYNEAADVWAVGIIVFALLTGRFPFDDAVPDNIEEKILYNKLKFA